MRPKPYRCFLHQDATGRWYGTVAWKQVILATPLCASRAEALEDIGLVAQWIESGCRRVQVA